MSDSEYKYNIDSLTLKMCCPKLLFNQLSFLPSGLPLLRDGYNVSIIEKDTEYNPNIIYLQLAFEENKSIGVIQCKKNEQEALFYIDKEIFYSNAVDVRDAVFIEEIIKDLGFDPETVSVVNMTIVRDSLWDSISEIEKLTEQEGYYPVIYSKDSVNCYLTDYYYFGEPGMEDLNAKKLKKKKACILTNILGSLNMRVFCLSEVIKDLTHEDYINEYNGTSKGKSHPVYRTEISFNDYQLQQYFINKGVEYSGYYPLCQFFNPEILKDLFDFLKFRILFFVDKEKNEIIQI